MKTYEATEYAYKNGYKKGKADALMWIPVTERLPEADKQVLVFTVHGNVKVARCNFYKNGTEVNWATNDGLGERSITHWMPLPEPPNKELSRLDLVRRMDNQQLAQYLYSLTNRDFELQFCQNKTERQELVDSDGGVPEENCLICLLHYLQQPGIAGNNT